MPRCVSPIRWAGGKSWFIPHFNHYTESLNYNRYIEPFLGGASVFLSMEHPHEAYLSDVNEELILAYQTIRDHPEDLIRQMQQYPNTEEEYYRVRALTPEADIERAARFMYLNYTSFNGIYRVNQQGVYNVPYGFRNVIFDYDKIRTTSRQLQGANIICGDFTVNQHQIQHGDLVFLDPPYSVSRRAGENVFIKYNARLFSLDEQHRLSRFIDYIKEQEAYYILTHAVHETIYEIFHKDGDRCEQLTRASLIGGRNAQRGQVTEYLFTNIPEREE